MPDMTKVELGKVQQTLFFPLLARARETQGKRPLLRDPKALEVTQAVGMDFAGYLEMEHKMAAKRDLAFWQWSCEDPRTLERYGLRLLETATATRPPAGLRATLPARYRYLLRLADPIFGSGSTLSLFQAAAGPAEKA